MAWWWWSATAWAATLRVGPTQPFATIGAAVDAAGPGDVIEIAPGTYDEAVTAVAPDLTLTALGAVTWIGRDETLLAVTGGRMTVLGVTFRPDGGRAITASGADLHLFNVDVRDNARGGDGAGLAALDGASVTLQDCVFADNTGDEGAHLWVVGAAVTAEDTRFEGGRARIGGAVRADAGADVTLARCSFDDHAATGAGGVLSLGTGTLSLDDVVITTASANTRGGVLNLGPGAASATITASSVAATSARTSGGGFFVDAGASLTLDGVRVTDASTQGSGGVVAAEGAAAVHVARSAFCSSVASQRGGVLRLLDVGEASVVATTAVRSGAAWGGVVHAQGATALTLRNVHLLDSVATRAGGGVYVASGADVVARATLFAWTLGGHAVETDGVVPDLDHNAFFSNVPADVAPGLATGRVVPGDPLLRDYRRNDRCDDDALQPQLGSPLIDAGEPGATDPDGSPADIGAFGGAHADPAWFADADVDGSPWVRDCDDTRADVRPGAVERCDGLDNDCDGAVDSPSPPGAPTWYRDDDGDGYGADATARTACDAPPRFVDLGGDCDDADDAVYPLAPEVCDGKDNDCDGSADGLDAEGQLTWYRDDDGDGFGTPAQRSSACEQPPGYALSDRDCDDSDPAVHPGAEERCDDVDNDCDGLTDEDDAVDRLSWYADGDGDGWGVDGPGTVLACDAVPGLSRYPTDCDDADPTVHPYAAEPCDPPEDRNCDGSVGDADADNDGVRACEDCVDTDPDVYPGAPETWYDGLIQDCRSASDFDQDGDGFEAQDWGGTDCDDADPSIYPAAPEVPDDGVDQDCDGEDRIGPEQPSTCAGCASGRSGGLTGLTGLPGGSEPWLLSLVALARRRRRAPA